MLLWAFFFLGAVTVRQESAVVRAGCASAESAVAVLPAGARVEIRFALNDGSNCYKVAAALDGKPVEGYVDAAALSGLEEFERGVRTAGDGAAVWMASPVLKTRTAVEAAGSDPAVQRAARLLEANQPGGALALLEPVLKRDKANPDLLALAGLAAYRSDRVRDALDYWKQSLEIRPDEGLAGFYRKVEREAASDRSSETLVGMRVSLRYEGEVVAPELARSMIAVLDEEIGRVASQLGCPTEERIVAIVQSRQAYLRSTDAAEWSGGQYDGRIRVALPELGRLGPDTRQVFAHEIVHACLSNLPGKWPAWLQEGLAQKLSGETLPVASLARLRQMAAGNALPRLENMGQSWSRMSAQHARLAYSLALAAADLLFENYASYGIQNILKNPEQFGAITADLDRRLGL